MTIRHTTKTDFCEGFCMGENKILRQVNIQYKQEHSMFYTQTSQHLVSRRHPHVAMCIRCFDIRNVPNPWPIFTPIELWGQVIGHRKGGHWLTVAGEEFLLHIEGVQAKCRWKEKDSELIGTYHQLGAILLQCSPGGFGQIRACNKKPSQFTEV